MKIFFDHQIFLIQKYGGVSRYFSELAKHLSCQNNEVEIIAPTYTNRYIHKLTLEKLKIHGIFLNNIPKGKSYLAELNNFYSYLYLKNNKCDVFHETFYSPRRIAPKNQPVVVTVYDMIHEKFPEYFANADQETLIKKKSVERADRIIAISETTKRDLVDIFKIDENKIDVIYLSHPQNNTVAIPFEVSKEYILYVGDRGGYKNFSRVLEAFNQSTTLKKDFNLICFGGRSWSGQEKTLISSYGLDDNVKHMSGGDDVLTALYKNAKCFVYPSLYEGFGLPPLEAMVNNCPCVVSFTSSIPEVCGDAASYFDPNSSEDMRIKIEEVCYQQELRSSLISRGHIQVLKFSWSKCASETVATYRKIL